MIKTSIEKLSEEIGYDIGMSDDKTQQKLINGLCNALKTSMNDSNLDIQICYIVKGLNDNSIFVLKKINEFIDLK